MLLDLCPCLAGSFEHSSHICVKFFGIQVVTIQMCTYYASFRVKAKGVIYERVHIDIGLYMRVHIYRDMMIP